MARSRAEFDWPESLRVRERILDRNQWEQMLRALPTTSPLFRHDRCEKGRCRRANGSRLHASTIKSVGYALATFAQPDGTNAHPGIGAPKQNKLADDNPLRGLMLATSRSKITVVACLRHLETVGLIIAHVRGGTMGLPRHFATIYCLTHPPIEIAAGAEGESAAVVYSWFTGERTDGYEPG
jgi:hypothetical protein